MTARTTLAAVATAVLSLAIAAAACTSRGGAAGTPDAAPAPPPDAFPVPAFLVDPHVLVDGLHRTNTDCRTDYCKHNENTDLIGYHGAIFLVHRTAESQVLGPNSALHIYRSTDGGATFLETAVILAPDAPVGRDLRDPHFFVAGGDLWLKALTRLSVLSSRDSNVDTVAVGTHSSDDGKTWTPPEPIGPHTQSFWRIQEHVGTFYTAAYQDGDTAVTLFTSTDGALWTEGPEIYGVAADTPLETELTFMPSERLLALVRMDGTNDELLGNARLRTKVCWADAPAYAAFTCDQELSGVRLDGPLTFFHGDRLFVVARKHLPEGNKKRTALYELTAAPGGALDGGPLAITELGVFPSAGDTSYAGQATVDATHTAVTWYSGDLGLDEPWAVGMLNATDIWEATIDFSKL